MHENSDESLWDPSHDRGVMITSPSGTKGLPRAPRKRENLEVVTTRRKCTATPYRQLASNLRYFFLYLYLYLAEICPIWKIINISYSNRTRRNSCATLDGMYKSHYAAAASSYGTV